MGSNKGVEKVVIKAAPSQARQVCVGDEVSVHYVGRVHGGHVFDSSRAREKEFNFVLGAGGVIKGWERGLPMMKVGETARLVIDPELGYGKKGMPPKIPPDATLEFEIEVLNSCKPIEKEVVEESESNVVAKEEDYVRINLVVKDLEGNVRDSYFQDNTLELYMKHHVAKMETNGTWRAGALLKKLVEQMVLNEKASFKVYEPIMDKHGNKPFWGDGAVELEIKLAVIGRDEDVNGDGGVVKHKMSEGQGYEKGTDGANLAFHFRIMNKLIPGGRVREKTSEGELHQHQHANKRNDCLSYDKWDQLVISDDGDIIDSVPPQAQRALEDAEAAKKSRENDSAVYFSTWESGKPASIIAGFGETCEGLEDALMSMKQGEHSVFTIREDYGFAAHDGQPPCEGLPGDCALIFEIQLISIGKGLEHWNLSYEEKQREGLRKRMRGNEFFKQEKYRRALKLYDPLVSKTGYFMKMPQRPSQAAKAQREAAEIAGHKIHNVANAVAHAQNAPDTEDEKALKLELQLPSLLNIAACKFKLGDMRGVIDACDQALDLQPRCEKAFYRRAQAHAAKADFDLARNDLQQLLQISPDNAEAKREMAKLQKMEDEARRKAKKAFGGIFKKGLSEEGEEEQRSEGGDASSSPAASSSSQRVLEPKIVEQRDFEVEPNPTRAQVKSIKKFQIPLPDVAPKVRIAGMYGGDDGDDGDE
uniref:peptidylprolyl isomerase n=1 Tax=Guillardia theta TaxID=55529 RepID=A0A7S4JGE5_GUITH